MLLYGPIRLIILNRGQFGKSVANPWTLADHDRKSKSYLDRTILCFRNNLPCTLIISLYFSSRTLSHFTFRCKLNHTVSNRQQVRRYYSDIAKKSKHQNCTKLLLKVTQSECSTRCSAKCSKCSIV